MSERCPFWREYDSVNGPVCYCELAAFGKTPDFQDPRMAACTPERRRRCQQAMEMAVGYAAVPQPPAGGLQTKKKPQVAG